MIRVDGKMTDRIGFLEDLFGVKIRYTTNADEMRLIAGRMPAKRKNYFGCYDADSRMVHLFLRSGEDCTPSSVDATVLFHLVGAKGLKGALGRKNWEAVCERVARGVFPGMEGGHAELVSAGEGVILGCGEGSPRWKDIAAAVSEVTGLDACVAETLPASQAHYERTSYNEARKEKDLAGLAEAMRRGIARQEGRTMMVCSCGPMGAPYRKAGYPDGMELMLNVGKLNGFLRSSGMDAGDVPTEKLLDSLQRPLAIIRSFKFGDNLVFTDIRTPDGGFLSFVIPAVGTVRGNSVYVDSVRKKYPIELIGCLKHKENIVSLRLSEDGKTSEVLRYLEEFRKADPNSLYKKGDPAEHPSLKLTDSITRDLSLYTKVDKKSESASKSDDLFEKYGIERNADGQLERHKPYRKGDPAEHPSIKLTDSITRDLNLCANIVKDFESASRADELYAKFGITKKTEEKFDLAGAVGKLMAQEAAEAAAAAVSVQSVRVRPLSERQKTPISEKWFTPSTVRKMNGAGLYSAMDLFVYGSGRVRDTFGPKAARDMERFISAAGLNLRPVKVTKTAMADIVAENINALPAPAPSLSLPMPRNAEGRFFDGPSCISLLSAMALNEGRWGSCGVFVSEEDANACSLALLPDAVPCRVDSVAGEVKVYNLADTTLGTVNPEALSMLVDECMNNPAQTYYLNVMESLRGSAAAVVEKFFRYMAAKPRPYEPDMKPTPLAEALVNAPDLRIGKPFVTEDENDIVMKADSDIEAKVSAIRHCLAGSGAEVATVEDAVPVLRAAGATPEEAESVRAALAAGVSINGVSLANGRTVVIADNIGSEEQLRLTFIHERTHRYLAENPALVESLAQEIEPGTEGALLSSLLPDKDTLTVYEGKGWKAMVEEAVCYAMEKALSVKAEDLSRTLSRAGVSSLPFIDFIKREDARMRALLPADPFRREPDLTPDVRMDIWAGPGGSHRELSNMAQRPFELGGQRFTCVEQCFQYRKAQLAGDAEAMRMILASGDGFEAKRLGSGARGLDVARWDAVKEEVMKEAMRASFEQNPDAAAALLATGNATLTHEKDHRWSEAFPRLLTEVRMEMRHGYDIVERKAPGVYLALRHNPDDGRMWAYVVDAAGRSLTGFSPAEMETMHLEVSEDGGLDLQAHAHYDIQGPDGLPQKKLVVSGPAFHIVPDWEAFMRGENLYRQSVRGLGIDPDLVKAEFMPLLMHERKDEPVTVEEMPDGGTRQSYEFRRINDTLRAVTEFSADGTKRSEYTVLLNEWGPWKTGWDIEYDGEGRVSALRTVDYISSLDEETRSGALRFTPEGRVSVLDTYREIKEEEGNFEFPCEQLNDSVRTHFRIRQLAPNGRKSNLTPQLYDYVRTPEFIGRYGDWMHGDAHTPLDGNGEPLVLWHGSMASFDRFDLSHAGDNTGIVEYTDRRTGEKILSDSDRAMFFTSDRNSAISYAFLAKTQEAGRIEGDLRDIASLIRTGGKDAFVHRIKSRKQLLEEVEFLRSRGDVFIDNALGFIDTASERPISSVPESLRDDYADTVLRVAKTYGERYRLNDRGRLSNRQNNISGQMEYLKYFRENIGRLCANDAGVKTEHDGDFLQYNQSFFSADGGYGVSIHFVDGRMKVYGFREGAVHMDEFTDDDRTELLGKIESDLHACAEKYNETLRESGFGKATHLYPVFLHTEKPLEHDYRGSAFPDKYKANERYDTAYVAARQVQKALREGNDAVVYRNVMDPHMMDTYGVFSADQIEMIDAEKYGLGWELSPELFMYSDEMKEAAEVKARTEAVGTAREKASPEQTAAYGQDMSGHGTVENIESENKIQNTMDIENKIDEALSEFRSQHEMGFISEEEMNGKAVDFITEALGGHATAEQLDEALSRNGYASAESISGEKGRKSATADDLIEGMDNLVGYVKDILVSHKGNVYILGASMAQAELSPDELGKFKEEAVDAALEASAHLYEDEDHPELAKLKVRMSFEERLDALTGPEFLSKSAAAKEWEHRTGVWPSEVTMYGEGVFVMKYGGAGFLVGRDGGRLVEDLLGDPAPYVGEDGIVRAHVWRNERDEAVYFESATGEVPAAVQRSIADRLVDEIVVGDELLAEHEVRDWLRTQSAKDISLFEMEVEDKAMKRFGPLSSIARNTRKAVEREISEWVGNMHAAVNQMESDGIRTFRSGEGFNTVADRLVFGEGNMYGEHKPDVTSPLKMRDEVLMREKGIFPRSPEERAMGYVPAESVNVGRMMKAVRSAYRSGKSLDDLLWKADGEKPGAPAVLEDRGPYERSVSSVSIYEQFRGVLEDAKAHPLVDYVMNFDIKPGSFSQTGYLGLEYAFLMKRAMADVFGDEAPRNVIIPESWLATGLFRLKEDGKGIQESPVDELVREPETEAQPLKKGLLFGVREALSLSGREARDVLSLFNHQGEREIVVLERPVSVERDGVEYEIRECVRDGHDYMFNAYAGSQESMEEGAPLVLGLADLKPYELKDISDEARRMNESQAEMQGLRMEVMRMLRDAAADGSADALVPLGLTVVLDNGNEYPVHGVSVRDGVLVWRWSADGSGNEDMMEESTGGCLTDESVRRLASVVQEAGKASEGEDKGMDVAGQETEGFRLPGGAAVKTLEDGRDVICDMNGNPLHEGTVISGKMNYGVFSGRIQMSNGTVKTFTFYGNTGTLLIGGQVSVLSVPEKGRTPEDVLVFTESDDSKYNVRTRENARACDVTVAFATDFTTAGEVWTAYYAGCQDLSHLPVEKAGPAFGQPVVPKGPDKYIACDWGMSINQMADHIEDVLRERGLRDRPVSLNIAGNGIYTFAKEGVSQEAVDDAVYRVMKKLRERGVMISSVRSGGQTGADEAGAKAGVRLHIPTEVHAPKGYRFRDAGGKDISGGEAFRARFDGVVNEALGREEKESEAVSKSPIIFTSDRSGVSMVTLDRNIAVSDVTMVLTVGNLTQGDADTIARAGGKAFHVALDVNRINATGTAEGNGYRAKDLDGIVESYLAQGLTPKDVSLFITGSKRPAIEYSGVDPEKLQRIVNCIVYVMKEKVGVSAVRSTGRPGDMDCYGIRAAVKNGLVPTIYAEKGYPGYGEDGGGYMEYVDAYLDILPDRQGPSVERSAKKADDGQETETKGREKGAVTVVTGTEGEADVTVLNVNDDERLSQFDIDRLKFPKGTVMRLNGVETKFGNGASIRDAAIMMFGLEPDWGYNVNRRYMSNLPGKDSPLFNADMMDVDGKGRTVLKVSLPEYRDYLYDNALYPLFRECMKLRPEQFSNAKAAITTAAHDDGNTLVKLVDREGFTGRLLTDFMSDAPARNVNLETGEVVADAEAVAVERERPKVDYADGPRVSVSGLNKMSEADVSAMIPEEADTVLKIGPNKGGRKGYLKKDSLEKVVKASGAGELQYLKPSAGGDGAEAIRTAALNGKNVHLLVNESDPVKCPETYGMLQEMNASGVKVEWISKGRGDAIRQESQSEVIERAIFPKVILQGGPEQLRFNALREIIPDEGVVVDTPVLYRKENEIFSGRFNFGNEMRIEPGRSTNQEQNCADIAKGVDFMLSFGGRNARKLESGTEARRMSNVLVFKDVMGADLNLERLDDAGYAKLCARKFIDRMIEKMTVSMYAGESVDSSALSLGFTGMTGAELAVKPYFRKSASEEDLKTEGADVSKSNIPAMDELVGITATNMAADYGMTVHEEADRKKSFGHSYSQVEFSDLPNADFSTRGETTPMFTFLRNFLGYLNDLDLVKSIAERRGAASLEPNTEFDGAAAEEEIRAGHVEVVNVGAYENKVEGFLASSPGCIYIGRMKGSPKVGSPLVYDGSLSVEDFVRSLPDPSALIRTGGNILGNPFTHKDGTAAPVKMLTREQSVQAYSVLFDILYGKDSEYTAAIDGIFERLKNGEDITFGCWCKPAACHGDVLKRKLSEKLDMEMRKSRANARRAVPVFHVASTVTDGDNGCNMEFSNASASLGLRTSLHPTKDYKTTTIDGDVMGFSYKGRRLRDGAAEAVFVNRTRLGLENEVTGEQLMQKAKDSMELFMEERQGEQPGLSDRQAFALHFAGVPDGDIALIDALCRDEVVAGWDALSAKVMDYYGVDQEYEKLLSELKTAEQREKQQAEFIERYARSRDAVVKVFADEMEKGGTVKAGDIPEFLERLKARVKDEEHVHMPANLAKMIKDTCKGDLTAEKAVGFIEEFDRQVKSSMEKRSRAVAYARNAIDIYSGPAVAFTPEVLEAAALEADADVRRHAENGQAFGSFKRADYPAGWLAQRTRFFESSRIEVRRHADGSVSLGPKAVTVGGQTVRDEGVVDHIGEGKDVDVKVASRELDSNPLFYYSQGPLELLDRDLLHVADSHSGSDEDERLAKNLLAPALRREGIVPVLSVDSPSMEGRSYLKSATNALATEMMDNGAETVMFVEDGVKNADIEDLAARNVRQGGVNIAPVGNSAEAETPGGKRQTAEKAAAKLCRASAVLNATGVPYLSTPFDVAVLVFAFAGKLSANMEKAREARENEGKPTFTFTPDSEGINQAVERAKEVIHVNHADGESETKAGNVEKLTRPNYDTVDVVRYEDKVHLFVDGTHENVMETVMSMFAGKATIHDTSVERNAVRSVSETLSRRAVTMKNPVDGSVEEFFTERGSYVSEGAEELIKPVSEERLYFVKGRLYDLATVPELPKGLGIDIEPKVVRDQTLPAFDRICDVVERAWEKVKNDPDVGLDCDVHTSALHPVINRIGRELRIMEGDALRCRVWIDRGGNLMINESTSLVDDMGDEEGHAVLTDKLTSVQGSERRNVNLVDRYTRKLNLSMVEAIGNQLALALTNETSQEKKVYGLMERDELEDQENRRKSGELKKPREDNLTKLSLDLDKGRLEKAGQPFDRSEAYVYVSDMLARKDAVIAGVVRQIEKVNRTVAELEHLKENCKVNDDFYINMEAYDSQIMHAVEERDALLDAWRKAVQERVDLNETRERLLRARNVTSLDGAPEGAVKLCVDNVVLTVEKSELSEKELKKAESKVKAGMKRWSAIRNMEKGHTLVISEETVSIPEAGKTEKKSVDELEKKIEEFEKYLSENEKTMAPAAVESLRKDIASLKAQRGRALVKAEKENQGEGLANSVLSYDLSRDSVQKTVRDRYLVKVEGGYLLCRPDGTPVNNEVAERYKPFGHDFWFVSYPDGTKNIINSEGLKFCDMNVKEVMQYRVGQNTDMLLVLQTDGNYNILNLRTGHLVLRDPATGQVTGTPVHPKICGNWVEITATEHDGDAAFRCGRDGKPLYVKVDSDGNYLTNAAGQKIPAEPGEKGSKIPLKMLINVDGQRASTKWMTQVEYVTGDNGKRLARFTCGDGVQVQFDTDIKILKREDLSVVNNEGLDRSRGITRADAAKK